MGKFNDGETMNAEQQKQSDRVLAALKAIDLEDFERVEEEPITFNTDSWNKYLSRSGRKDLATILRAVPSVAESGSITRSDVITLARGATRQPQREALLVGTLVWGKGMRNNRMFPAFERLLTDTRLDTALVTSAEHARAGRPAVAYRAWRESGVKGLGEAFFTKWLWAASHVGEHRFSVDRPRCLVLDARVWRTLGHRNHRWSSVVAAGTDRRAERYEAYTSACERWAKELGRKIDGELTAEQVEWALFKANGPIKKEKFKQASTAS
jgi:hypothetical protein